MRRRDFLKAASGVTAAAGGASTAAADPAPAPAPSGSTAFPAQEANETETGSGDGDSEDGTPGNETSGDGTSGGELPGMGTTETVVVGPGGENVFDPETLYVQPGTTVEFTWESDNHNVVVESQPEGANWNGTEGEATVTYDTGHEYSHQFTTTGTYEYFCNPHRQVGMVGEVIVNQSGEAPGSEGGGEVEANPEEMGVPFQAHFVGIATIVMILVSLVYTFFTVKYGTSRHASSGD